MTKYLETKRNSIEEAISSVVLGENGFVVGKVKMSAQDEQEGWCKTTK